MYKQVNHDIQCCKNCGTISPVSFRIRCGSIRICPSCSLHYLDHLDECDTVDPKVNMKSLTAELTRYLETNLQSSEARFNSQIDIIRRLGAVGGSRILDIGCGGGLFMAKARELGARVTGIELDDGRAAYCIMKHGLDVVKHRIEDPYWQRRYGTFDFVTMWDVIEHVNFPLATLTAAANLLKRGGILVVDTPARDSFYYRVGVATYRATCGLVPSFLNVMYSNHAFGHKQILSTSELRVLFEYARLDVIRIEKFHELSFPCEFYLQKMTGSQYFARAMAPIAASFFRFFRLRNKMVGIACRLTGE